ncbi:right-handed parallel beta-helix repeat-containing protein [bacterium]|nr:right-handed parallel beta-helix repeat-containing protein [bacterium]
MNNPNHSTKLAGVAIFLLIPVLLIAQGALTPPGTPAPNMKSLDEIYTAVEANRPIGTAINAQTTPGDGTATFVIVDPGCYFLDEDVVGEPSKDGIRIDVDGVQIDLRGHRMTGNATSQRAINGMARYEIVIRNGIIDDWPGGGVRADYRSVIEDLILNSNGSTAIYGKDNLSVRRCRVFGNDTTSMGIDCQDRSLIKECFASHCVYTGIGFLGHCIVRDCVSDNNGMDGFTQNSSGYSIVEGCVAQNNQQDGFDLCYNNLLQNNLSAGNDLNGIYVRCGYNLVRANFVRGNAVGIKLFANSNEQVYSNTLVGNTTDISGETGNSVGPEQSVATATSPTANLVD